MPEAGNSYFKEKDGGFDRVNRFKPLIFLRPNLFTLKPNKVNIVMKYKLYV